MPAFLHRTTKEYRTSVSYSDLTEPLANYIEEPDLSAVTGFDRKYWTITGDVVSLMSQAERDAVDAAVLEASRDSIAAQLDQVEDIQRAFMLVMLDQLNTLRDFHGLSEATPAQLKTAVRNKLGS